MNSLRMLWKMASSRQRQAATWGMLLIVAMALVETAGVLSIVPFLTILAQPDSGPASVLVQNLGALFDVSDARDLVTALGLLSIGAVLFASIFKAVTLSTINRMIHGARHSLSSRLLGKYLNQPYEFFLERNASILSKNVLSEVDQLHTYLIQPIAQVAAQGAVVIAMLIVMVWHDPPVAFGLVVVVGSLYGGIYLLVRAKMIRLGRERQQSNSKRHQTCNEVLSGIKDVKVTASVAPYWRGFDISSARYSHQLALSDTLSQTPLYLVEAVGYTGLIVVSLVLVQRTGDLSAMLPTLGLFGFAAYRMLPACQIIYRGLAKLRFSAPALEGIFRDLQLPDPPPGSEAPVLAPQREIRLSGVSFAYPNSPHHNVISDFDLVIPALSTSGIRGPSGAGKSTLMDLLLGLLHPDEGSIQIDGVVLDHSNVGSWQKSIGYVPQHIYLSDATIAENIAFGVPAGDIDLERLALAAKRAQIHDFVTRSLPDGYDTKIGDRGIRLSGGQRQRVGIARALYRDPPVLFLDEATSALDKETLRAFSEVIESLSGRKTIVVIAHQDLALQNCDFITDLRARPE